MWAKLFKILTILLTLSYGALLEYEPILFEVNDFMTLYLGGLAVMWVTWYWLFINAIIYSKSRTGKFDWIGLNLLVCITSFLIIIGKSIWLLGLDLPLIGFDNITLDKILMMTFTVTGSVFFMGKIWQKVKGIPSDAAKKLAKEILKDD